MIVEERITKDGQAVSRRANELGLKLKDIVFLDWTPMFVIIMYESDDAAAWKKAAALEAENAQLRNRAAKAG